MKTTFTTTVLKDKEKSATGLPAFSICSQRGEDPEKPFSGKFVVRLPTELHRKAYVKAKLADKSLNSWVTEVIASTVQEQG